MGKSIRFIWVKLLAAHLVLSEGSDLVQTGKKQTTFSGQKYWRDMGSYHANIFCPEIVVCFLRLLHLKIDFIMKANTINTDQTAPNIGRRQKS